MDEQIIILIYGCLQLQPRDINGKDITLRLNKDGDIGSFESASGKIDQLESNFES